ncbi:MAG: NADPH-dependent FMN reductase [Fluviicola sp.]|nr:MAG: NADPH-dependent FMN reductase [Fluviicola sp.]
MKKVVVLSGSIRNGRISHYVAQTVVNSLEKNQSVDTVLLDLKEYPFPMLEDRITSFPGKLQYFIDTLESADGIIIVTPEYKNSIPGPLKNLLDHLAPQQLKHIPMGIVTVVSGDLGGAFCLSQLRLVALALGCIPISEKFCISKVNDIFDKSGNLLEATFPQKSDNFVEAMMWYVERLSIKSYEVANQLND